MHVQFRRFPWALMVVLLACSPRLVYAACRGDRKVDVPMQFTATIESAGRLHLSAYGGSDRSGWVGIGSLGANAWTIKDSSGKQLDYFLLSPLVFASMEMLKETNVEGLVPGATYTIQLASLDSCSNMAYVSKSVTMPLSNPETNDPLVSAPDLVATGFLTGISNVLHFSATDDTGIARVSIYFNGTLIQEYKYFNDTAFRWWVNRYDLDNTVSTLEGPNYYVSYPSTLSGQSGLVEVVVDDFFGNRVIKGAFMAL